MGLKLGNPIGQLRHLEELILVLEIGRPHPQRIGDQPAEAAQRDGREGEDGRGVFQVLNARQAKLVAVTVKRLLNKRHAR